MKKVARPTFDQVFMEIAHVVAKRATCPRASVGCVITKDNVIVSTGYNGALRSLPHCTDAGCTMINGSCERAIHAEQNAVALAGRSLVGCTVYVTHYPCYRCFRILAQSGVREIHYANGYRMDPRVAEDSAALGIKIVDSSTYMV